MQTLPQQHNTEPVDADLGSQIEPAETFFSRSGSSPPELNPDIFGTTDAPDPLARALERAKASAGAAASAAVTCNAEGHSPSECNVARALIYGASQDCEWLRELTLAAQRSADIAFDEGFPEDVAP